VLETFPGAAEDIVSERLAGRLSRQAILERDDPPPPVICALIDQSALLREIGGPEVMRDQLSHLVALSRRPNITVQVIPNAGAHPGLLGAFTVAELGGSPAIVNIEDVADGRVTEDADTVSMVALRFHSLRGGCPVQGGVPRLDRECDAGPMEGSNAVTWRTSSYSGGNGGQCVEVADAASIVLVRDTTNRDGGTLAFTAEAWCVFADALK
jgi:hypothetical protein